VSGVYWNYEIAFLSLRHSGHQPSPKLVPGGPGGSPHLNHVGFRSRAAGAVSGLPVVVDRHDRKDSRRRQLLAMHEVRRRVERHAVTSRPPGRAPMALTRTPAVRGLLDLIAALDRRVPHVERAGEVAIARDAAELKARALRRIAELDRAPAPVKSK
jgi:hypothetical protein